MASAERAKAIPSTRLSGRLDALFPGRILSWRQAIVLASAFLVLLFLLNRLVTAVCVYPATDCLPTWPVSIYTPLAPGLSQIVMAMACVMAFALFAVLLPRAQYRLGLVLLAAFALCLATNLIQGVDAGYVRPQTWGGVQYYNEALAQMRSNTPLEFIDRYEEIQPDGAGLRIHGSTHPPGAILSHWALVQGVGKNPALVSVAVGLVALPLLGLFFHGILRGQGFASEDAGWLTFLFLLVPSVQAYGVASLDILIAAGMTGALYFFLHRKAGYRILGTSLCVFLVATMTFMVVFLVPVLLAFDLKRRSSLRTSVVVLALVLGGILALGALGYDWFNSFRLASEYENRGGPLFLVDPASYLFTRVEDWLDILVFFGPFLTFLLWRATDPGRLRAGDPTKASVWGNDLATLTFLGILSICALFATGAFRTGETARACLFLLPFLLFPIATYLRDAKPAGAERTFLLALVFGQAVIMHTSGTFYW